MHLHVFQHVPFEGIGSIQYWADSANLETHVTQFFRNEPLPPLPEVTHLIVMGGPMGANDDQRFPWLPDEKRYIRDAIDDGKAVMGICLGAQLIAAALGARVYQNPVPEIGWFPIHKSLEARSDENASFLPSSLTVFHWHGDTFDLPQGTCCLAHSAACPHQGFYIDRRIVGLQFHLETTRKSLHDLIENCADEIVEGPFIQPSATMRAVTDRFTPNQKVMKALLDQWVAA
jgi:GMP synthase-like glutamine amidotransferase